MISELPRGARNRAPVFVVGSPRSGNNFLYHTLLSSGGFAMYRAESQVFNMLVPRFGDLGVRRNLQKLLDVWFESEYFTRTGVDAHPLRERILAECRNGGDFLRIVMEETCRKQNADRWAEVTPEHLLFIPLIKKTIPNALIVHVIRDGRDVALSLAQKGFVRPFPGDRKQGYLVAALYWNWIVRRGRQYGRGAGPDYTEIHYEDLVLRPKEALAELGEFIGHDLDYDRIRKSAVGTVGEPNTSFAPGDGGKAEFQPVGRWKKGFTEHQLETIEAAIGPLLRDLQYPLATTNTVQASFTPLSFKRALYNSYFSMKQWIKADTPLARFLVNIDTLRDQAAFSR